MKFQVTFKTPDVIDNFVRNNMCSDIEPQIVATTEQYVAYGESITIEFDTEEQTAVVVKQ